jgi:predicted Zn-dependent protease
VAAMDEPVATRAPRRARSTAATRSVLAFVLLASAALLSCAKNPVTGKREINLVSTGQEEQMGREGYPAVVAEYGIYGDSTIQRYVNDVGQRLAKNSHLPNLEWHFTVIDDPAVNAFAMPGGYIYITRGIMAHLNSEAQLAGVMGHEIGHVTHRHTAEQITKQELTGLGLGVASMMSRTVRQYGDVAQQALGLMFLKFSRTDESEADALGVEYSTKTGWDPADIPATYAMLKRISDVGGQRLPEYMSTHPDPGNREVRTRELADAARAGKTGLVIHHDEYIQRLEGMVYGDDPRQGYFEGDNFYHPGLAFMLTFPAGWKHQNSHSAVVAQGSQTAGMQLSMATSAGDLSPADFVAKLASSGKITGSRGGTEVIGGSQAWVGRIGVPGDNGAEQVMAAGFLRRSPTEMFQILGIGASDADLEKVTTAIRSFRPLTDPARMNPEPARVHVTRATGGTFSALVSAKPSQGANLEDTAILNNRQSGDAIAAGTLLKTVAPAKTH